MDKRTKILGAVFGLIVAYLLGAKVVYPQWIEPVVNAGLRVEERRKELTKLEEREDRLRRATADYQKFIERTGATDAGKVEVEARRRLNELIARHKLENSTVTGGRSSKDNKTGIDHVNIDVSGEASMTSVISFIKEVSELPHLLRINNVKLSPLGGRKDRDSDRVNATVPIEIRVLPANKLAGPVDEAKLTPPEKIVRHQNRDYSVIWDRKPFLEYDPPKPIVVTAKPSTLNATLGQALTLQVSVAGGSGQFTYSWTPAEGLDKPNTATPKIDTTAVRSTVYTVAVSDTRGQTGSAAVNVSIQEKPAKPVETVVKSEPPPPPPPPPDPRWPDRAAMQLRMALLTSDGNGSVNELMVYSDKSQSTSYFKPGDEFDGGKLVFVHHSGGVVCRKDEYFVYPLGEKLDFTLTAAQAEQFPELQHAARTHRELNPPVEPATPVGSLGGMTPLTKESKPEQDTLTDAMKNAGVPSALEGQRVPGVVEGTGLAIEQLPPGFVGPPSPVAMVQGGGGMGTILGGGAPADMAANQPAVRPVDPAQDAAAAAAAGNVPASRGKRPPRSGSAVRPSATSGAGATGPRVEPKPNEPKPESKPAGDKPNP